MKLQNLVDFQVLMKHDFSTPHCKAINESRAILCFSIGMPDGSIQEKRVDVSFDELRNFRKEIKRIEETLS